MRFCRIILFFLCTICFISVPFSYSQNQKVDIEALKKMAPKIFIDCRWCDIDYIRTEITFVNYVRDRKEAQVHILITTQPTGGGGTEFTMAFMGQKDYEGNDETLKFISSKTDTEDEIRKGIVRVLKMGLMRYVAKTPIADRISISFIEKVKPTSVEDKWNFWVFSVSARGFFNGEKSVNYNSLSGSFSANRVTPDLKIRTGIYASYNENNFKVGNQTISSITRSQSFSSLVVKSINEHWSIGAWVSGSSSIYSNIKLALSPAPAIEYNLFPYSEFTRRQLRFLYKAGYNSVRYREETIFFKTAERLWNEALSVTLELKEKWGTISASLEGSHYFHDLSKNRIQIYSELSLRIFKGLSFNLFGSYSRIHDQLSLPKGGATLEQILLRRTILATTYNYFASIGLSYTFGSIYSNVVNPRFGSYPGGGMIITYY